MATVDIRPGVSVLSVLRHLNYKPWFALAEFVDNSLQSFLSHRDELVALHGPAVRLRVSIELRDTPKPHFRIFDNAAGIANADYERAFRPAEVPLDRTGLSEFGMGMKSASCWFSPKWRVRTKALGENSERTVEFDIERIVHDQINELEIKEKNSNPSEHFTEIFLEELYHRPVGRTVGKIKEHLADIYRVFILENTLNLIFDGTPLRPEEPDVLYAPYFKTPEEKPVDWRKDIDFDFGSGLSVSGFAAIRAVGSTQRAGFALFRRKRLIQGSADEGYRPEQVFGNSNSYRYQRLFGELHLSGFDVSHTKDGFQWDENEETFLSLLREHLDSDELPLLKQAEGYRARQAKSTLENAASTAVQATGEALGTKLQNALENFETNPNPEADPPEGLSSPEQPLASHEVRCRYRGEEWRILIELTNDTSELWVEIADRPSNVDGTSPRELGLRVSMAHPFMVRFAGADPQATEALLRVACALGIGEVVTREAGYRGASVFLQNVNELMEEALAQP